MNIQEHLSNFDRWLTSRIDEARATRKDLAFRDLGEDDAGGAAPWEYSLLDPGAHSPPGEGWTVYRFSGAMPGFSGVLDGYRAPSDPLQRRSMLGSLTAALRGRRG